MKKKTSEITLPEWAANLTPEQQEKVRRLLFNVEELEAENRRKKNILFQLGKMAELGIQTASVIHEFRQPMLGIKSFAQMILEKQQNLDEKQKSLLDMMLEQLVRMEGMLESLRRFFHNETRETADVLFDEPLESVLKFLEYRLKKRRIKLDVKMPEERISVNANTNEIQQILINLLQNALDAAQGADEGFIAIEVKTEGADCIVTVYDNGSGIPDQLREKIFQVFFTTKPRESGTGLGLAICREILIEYGADLELLEKRELPEGLSTGFRFSLPLSKVNT